MLSTFTAKWARTSNLSRVSIFRKPVESTMKVVGEIKRTEHSKLSTLSSRRWKWRFLPTSRKQRLREQPSLRTFQWRIQLP